MLPSPSSTYLDLLTLLFSSLLFSSLLFSSLLTFHFITISSLQSEYEGYGDIDTGGSRARVQVIKDRKDKIKKGIREKDEIRKMKKRIDVHEKIIK